LNGVCRTTFGVGDGGDQFRRGVDVGGVAPDANGPFFHDTARTAAVPILWLHADHDPYDSASAIQRYRATFEGAGGQGPFVLFPDIGGNGHYVVHKPLFWRPVLDAYLQQLGLLAAPQGESNQGH